MAASPTPRDAAGRALRALWVVYGLTVVIVALTRIDNNFVIFRTAFTHVVSGQDLYAWYPEVHEDRFKYSPTFALLFAPFALPPLRVALALWTAVNVLLPAWALTRIFAGDRRAAALALAIAYLDVLRSAQRAQSNGLVAACIMGAWLAYAKRRELAGGAAIALGGAVKLFPLAGGILAFLFERPVRALAGITLAVVVAAVLPYLVLPTSSVTMQYLSWKTILTSDASSQQTVLVTTAAGLYGGVMAQLRIWFGYTGPNWVVQLIGTLLLCAPLVVRAKWRHDAYFRRNFLASVLLYAVIFNHQSESPSYVIAMCGVAIWYAASPQTRWHTVLAWASVLVVSVSSTDLVPRNIQETIFVPYLLKTVPCALVWGLLQLELLGLVPWTRGGPEQSRQRRERLAHAH